MIRVFFFNARPPAFFSMRQSVFFNPHSFLFNAFCFFFNAGKFQCVRCFFNAARPTEAIAEASFFLNATFAAIFVSNRCWKSQGLNRRPNPEILKLEISKLHRHSWILNSRNIANVKSYISSYRLFGIIVSEPRGLRRQFKSMSMEITKQPHRFQKTLVKDRAERRSTETTHIT